MVQVKVCYENLFFLGVEYSLSLSLSVSEVIQDLLAENSSRGAVNTNAVPDFTHEIQEAINKLECTLDPSQTVGGMLFH